MLDCNSFGKPPVRTKYFVTHPPVTVSRGAPDAVVVAHHVDALGVRQVAVLDEQAEDAPAAELELLPDHALQVGHHAARVQVHEQPAHAAAHGRRRRVVKVQAQSDEVITVGCHTGYNTTTHRLLHSPPPCKTKDVTSAQFFQLKWCITATSWCVTKTCMN